MDKFLKELASHPDQQQVSYVLQGLQHGFRLGFKPAKRNKPSVLHHAHIMLMKSLWAGLQAPSPSFLVCIEAVLGSFLRRPSRQVALNSRFVFPRGASLYDGIDPQDFSLQYIEVDQVIRMVSRYGPGVLMAKLDVESTYRNIPVHPDDRFLLGMRWRGQFYTDLLLPFGLHSAPFIFNSVANMVEWTLLHKHRLSDLLHYLDDFITTRPPQSSQCAYNLNTAISVRHRLGFPLTLTNLWVWPLL